MDSVSNLALASVLVCALGCGGTVADNGPGVGSNGGPDAGVDATTREAAALSGDAGTPEAPYTADGGLLADGELSTADPGQGQTACGAAVCNAANEVCCRAGSGAVSCTGLNACAGTPFVCSGAQGCPAPASCCAFFVSWGTLAATECRGCDSAHPAVCTRSSQCAADEECQPMGGGGYGVCSPLPGDL